MSQYAVMPIADYTAACDTIREKTGSTEVIKSGEMPSAIDEVYAAGEQSEYDISWDACQNFGKRTDYQYGFAGSSWNGKTFKPKYDIKPKTTYGRYLFYRNSADYPVSMLDIEQECGITFDFSKLTNHHSMFANSMFSVIKEIDISNSTATNEMFYLGYSGAHILTRIEGLVFSENTAIASSMFGYCDTLTYIGFNGTIASSLNASACPLTPESMKMAILCLKDYLGTDKEYAYKITFSDTCWAALEADSTAPDGGTWAEYVDKLGWNT